MERNFFVKSHGLGNEYLVFDSENITFPLTGRNIRRICNVNFGIGSDGLLLKVASAKADFGLRIFNPDGSEAEKSGNGLRIFCKFLYDYKFASSKRFTVETKGGIVAAEIVAERNARAQVVKIDMGKATFETQAIPVRVQKEEWINEPLQIQDQVYRVNCVSVGNPHCVIIKERLEVEEIKKYGTFVEHHALFPNRVNVQFAKPVNSEEVEVLIWERGAGFTLASGSSSCAVAAVMVKRGLTGRNVRVKMPGGELEIEVGDDWEIKMTGEVRQIAEGVLSEELVEELEEEEEEE
jgi:diaminopimelate epimerase